MNRRPAPDRERHAVRAILLSPDAQVLMMRFVAPDRSVWITPGGGLLDGEDPLTGLARELREETARGGFLIGPEVWTRSVTFDLAGETVLQHERYFLVRTERFEPPAEMPDEVERRWFGGFRWWSVEQIRSCDELFAPRRLGRCLADLLASGPPDAPFDVGR